MISWPVNSESGSNLPSIPCSVTTQSLINIQSASGNGTAYVIASNAVLYNLQILCDIKSSQSLTSFQFSVNMQEEGFVSKYDMTKATASALNISVYSEQNGSRSVVSDPLFHVSDQSVYYFSNGIDSKHFVVLSYILNF